MAPKFNLFRMAGASGSSGGPPAEAGTKRRLSALEALPVASKLPRASGGSSGRPATAPVVLTVRKYGDSASDFLSDWPEGEPAWQVQFTHDAAPSLAINIVDGMNRFLADLREQDPGMPGTLAELKRATGVSLVVTRLEPNPYAAPLVNWRIAFYAVGAVESLQECLKLIYGYIAFRATHPLATDRLPFEPPEDIKVSVHRASNVAELTEPQGANLDLTFVEPSLTSPLPHGLFEAGGPINNKFLVAEIDVVDGDTVAVGWTGRTWLLRHAFEEAGIGLATDEGREPTRLIPASAGRVDEEAARARLIEIFGSRVLRNGACIVRVTAAPPADSNVAAFLKGLRALPHLAFLSEP